MADSATVRRRLVIGTTVKEQLVTSFFPHLEQFIEAGWEVHLVAAPGAWPQEPPNDVYVHEIPMVKDMSPVSDSGALARWVTLLRDLKPDAVVGGSPKGALLAMVSARAAGVPVRVYLHRGARWESLTGVRRRIMVAADRLTASAATEVVAVSRSLADALRRAGIVQRPPTLLGAGGSKGVDLERFSPLSGSDSNSPVLGYVGRISRDKGLETVLAAWDHVRGLVPDVRLQVVGDVDPVDPPEPQVLQRLRDEPGIEWLGWRGDVDTIMPGFTVLLLPSAREGLPNVVIEAAACGVPSVGWDVTGVRDAICDQVSGRLVPWGDVAEFSAAVAQIVTDPDQETQRNSARQWATRFDQRQVTSDWVALLDPTSTGTPESGSPVPVEPRSGQGPVSHAWHELGVVIVTYNSAETITDCVASLATHAPGAQVVIVDNSAQGDHIRRLAEDAVARSVGSLGSLTVVDAPGNVGYAAGVNLAVELLPNDCEFLLICNPDVVITADPRALIPGLEDADVTAGRLAGDLPNTNRATTYGSELLRDLAGVRFRYVDVPRGGGVRYVDQLAGAYLLQRSDYYRANPLDEQYELYYEDVDYCDRARERGRGVLLQDTIVGSHIGGASSGRVSPTTYVVGRVSRARYLRQRYPSAPSWTLLAPFLVEAATRTLTGQGEGSEARRRAIQLVKEEFAAPRSVRVLADETCAPIETHPHTAAHTSGTRESA
jgi:glycosyltransferase involved in cell wall biosynthesis/GT2 family glycosyltransferase